MSWSNFFNNDSESIDKKSEAEGRQAKSPKSRRLAANGEASDSTAMHHSPPWDLPVRHNPFFLIDPLLPKQYRLSRCKPRHRRLNALRSFSATPANLQTKGRAHGSGKVWVNHH